MEPTFNNTSNSNNHYYNDRSENPCVFPLYKSLTFICNNEYEYCFPSVITTTRYEDMQRKESTKIFHILYRKKILSILSCLHCNGTNKQTNASFHAFSLRSSLLLSLVSVSPELRYHTTGGLVTYASHSQQRLFLFFSHTSHSSR